MRPPILALLALACHPADPDGSRPTGPLPPDPPAPDAFEPPEGPGGPARTFADDELLTPCGYILGGPGDAEHHNLSVVHDGYLVHPWAPEDGGGGISFLRFDDPCAPEVVGQTWSDRMRETHTLAFGHANGREYLAVDALDPEDGAIGGVGIWDVTDRTAPAWVSEIDTPNFHYPDSYLRVTFSSFWQGPVLYIAAAFTGIHVVDVSDPLNPVLVKTVTFDFPHLVGAFHVIGNLGVAASAGTSHVELLDVSDPWDPRPIPGGSFEVHDGAGTVDNYYFSSVGGRYGLFARKARGGGPIIYDLSDPSAPTYVGDGYTDDGDGGYVYRQSDRLFQGDSNFGLIYDISDPTAPQELARLFVQGDLDTMSPVGNVVIVSVDEKATPGQASTVFPWQAAPDARPPALELFDPPDGAENVPVTGRIGLAFDEWIESASVFEGSFRVTDADGWPLAGTYDVQESLVNFTPDEPLPAGTAIRVVVPAGGITDVSGNPTAEEVRWQFTTAP
ncbi:MAG: Ig-like domain-containing protein [Myxococcota bacterium]